MTGSVDRRSEYWNRSDSSDVNRGAHGKLNAAQIEERARLHALRLAYGKPTLKDIAEGWYEKYQISIHPNTEKEWAWRNETVIYEAMNKMVEQGEIKLNIVDSTLANTLKVSGYDTAKLVKEFESNLKDLMKVVDLNFDPYAKLNISEDEVMAMTDEREKNKILYHIHKEEKKNELRLLALKDFSKMLSDHKNLLIKTVVATKEIFDDAKLKEKRLELEVKRQVGDVMARNKAAEDFDPLEIEITDEIRKGK